MTINKIILYKKGKAYLFRSCVAVCLLVLTINAKSQTQSLTVICNKKGVPDAIKLSELKSIMKGEKQRWSGGANVKIAIMKTTTAAGKNTAQLFYNMSGDALLKYILALTYQGNAQAPKLFGTAEELENYVAQNPGAIGVIDQPFSSNDIKIITVDGKSQFNL